MSTTTYLRSAAIGASSGLRSMTGPAVARWRTADDGRVVTTALALGELLADKTPFVPARTILPSLLARAASGGFAGAAVAAATGGDRRIGAATGALAAVAASFAGIAARRRIGDALGLPDPLVAVAEDALAIGAAIVATAGIS